MPGETLTERLRLLPVGPEHAADLVAVHRDGRIAEWYGGAWPRATAEAFALSCARGWGTHGVGARGLIEGGTGEQDNAPFAVYAIER